VKIELLRILKKESILATSSFIKTKHRKMIGKQRKYIGKKEDLLTKVFFLCRLGN